MKKLLFLSLLAMGMQAAVYTQVNPNAIGIRLGGDGEINGAELTYQKGLNDINRFEMDLGFGYSKFHNRTFIAGIYHWVMDLSGGLNWYVGPGASLGIYRYDDNDEYLNIALGGQIGIEYDFNVSGTPLLLSLDARPMWDFLGDNAGLGWGAALGIRYTW